MESELARGSCLVPPMFRDSYLGGVGGLGQIGICPHGRHGIRIPRQRVFYRAGLAFLKHTILSRLRILGVNGMQASSANP